MNYAQANEQLQGRCCNSRKIDNHTYLERRDNGIAIRLHNTDIITFKPNGDTVLNTGGWRTVTTKQRMCDNGFDVSQVNGIWYMGDHIFKDGITIKSNSTITNADPKTVVKEIHKLDKSLKQYVNDYIEALFDGKVPASSSGDCWDCCMKSKDGKTMGEISQSDHIKSHIREKYYVPSLLVNAIKAFPISLVAKDALGSIWKYHNNPMDNWHDIAKSQLHTSLKRYMRRQLGIAS